MVLLRSAGVRKKRVKHNNWQEKLSFNRNLCQSLGWCVIELVFPISSQVKESTCNAGDAVWSLDRDDLMEISWQGNPFQFSCLENSMDWRTWQATVSVTNSQTWLKWLRRHKNACDLKWIARLNISYIEMAEPSYHKVIQCGPVWGRHVFKQYGFLHLRQFLKCMPAERCFLAVLPESVVYFFLKGYLDGISPYAYNTPPFALLGPISSYIFEEQHLQYLLGKS